MDWILPSGEAARSRKTVYWVPVQETPPSVLQRNGAGSDGKGAACGAYVRAEIVVSHQFIGTTGTATGFVVHTATGCDGAAGPGNGAKLKRDLIVCGVLGNRYHGCNAASSIAGANNLVGHGAALQVRVLIGYIGAGDQHRLEAVRVEVDGATRHVIDSRVVDQGSHVMILRWGKSKRRGTLQLVG